MTDLTYDTTAGRDRDLSSPAPHGAHSVAAEPPPRVLSTLDQLRDASREVVDFEPHTVTNPKGRIRLICRTEIESQEHQRWQILALPEKERRRPQPRLTKMDGFQFAARVLLETCQAVEVKGPDGVWRAVTDQNSGEELTFKDSALLMAMGAPDPIEALRNTFNRLDPAILEASREVLDRAGYGDDDRDDDADPTP